MSKILEKITELIGWLQIVASPLLLASLIGAIIYFRDPNIINLIIASIIVALGLIVGILYANKILKTKGTIWFLSRISATPELDEETTNEHKN